MAGTYLEGSDVNRIDKFKREFLLEYQRMESDFKAYVQIDTDFVAEYKYFPKIGQVDGMRERSQRLEKTDWKTISENRRRMSKKSFDLAYAFDSIDELYGSLDISNPLMKQMMWEGLIKQDEIIIAAALGTAYEGKDGSTSVAFPATQVIDTNGTTGATFAKIKELRYKKKKNHIPSSKRLVWFVDPYQMNELLGISELISYDLNDKRDLQKGRVLSWADIDIVETTALTLTGGTIRETVAMTTDSVVLGMTQDIDFKTATLVENSFGEGLYMQMTAGAVRLQDESVWKIRCLES